MKSLLSTLILLAGVTFAQDVQTVTIPLTNPGEPVNLNVKVTSGEIAIETGDSDAVEVEVVRGRRSRKEMKKRGDGMRRIGVQGAGITAREFENEVVIRSKGNAYVSLTIRTPRRTSTVVGLTNDGNVRIEGLAGDHELKNTNGSIAALEIAGSVVANSTNGSVVVSFTEADPDKPMAFQSWNSKVDVTFPAPLNADLVMETSNGDIYSDFDIDLQATPPKGSRNADGHYQIELSGEMRGRVGRGGPVLRFKSFNGNVYVRKR